MKVFKKLIKNKATGIHDIPNIILKDNVNILYQHILKRFSTSLSRLVLFQMNLMLAK